MGFIIVRNNPAVLSRSSAEGRPDGTAEAVISSANTALWIVIVTGGFGAIAMLGDFLEMLRFANRFELGAGQR